MRDLESLTNVHGTRPRPLILGMEEAVRYFNNIRWAEKPSFVAIYGLPDHGKSYFCSKVVDSYKYGIVVAVNDLNELAEYGFNPDVVLVSHSYMGTSDPSHFDPGLQELFGRSYDMTILIVNPNFVPLESISKFLKFYTIVVSNPKSKEKNQ